MNAAANKTIFLYLHFNSRCSIEDYVYFQLEKMRDVGEIVFISNSRVPRDTQDALLSRGYCQRVLLLDNRGYDFGGWRQAISQLSYEYLLNYEYLVLMNDSCFGPIYEFRPIWREMIQKNYDFWGISSNKDSEHSSLANKHLQSYFLCFTREVVSSNAFRLFFENYSLELKTKEEAIEHGEAVLTQTLEKAGFQSGSYAEANDLDHIFVFPEFLNFRPPHSPFLKRYFAHPPSSFRDPYILSSGYSRRMQFLKQHTDYPCELIESFVEQQLEPDKDLSVRDKSTPILSRDSTPETTKLKTAAYLHNPSQEEIQELAIYLAQAELCPQLFVYSPDGRCTKDYVFETTQRLNPSLTLDSLTVSNETDWSSSRTALLSYDLVLHLNFDRSLSYTNRRHIFNSLLFRKGDVVSSFEQASNLALIYPSLSISTLELLIRKQHDERAMVEEVAAQLRMQPDDPLASFESLAAMSIWQTFWYRPKAFEQFFRLRPEDHACEPSSLLVYFEKFAASIAKDNGYTYSINFEPEAASAYFKMLHQSLLNSQRRTKVRDYVSRVRAKFNSLLNR